MTAGTITKKKIIRNTNFDAEYQLHDEKYINQDYFNNNYSKCEECNEYHLTEDMTDVGGSSEYKYICEYCLDNDYFYCDNCNEYHHNNEMVTCDWCDRITCESCSHTDDNNTTLCEHCYDNCCICDDCNCYISSDYACYCEDDGNTYCEECYSNHDNAAIHDYGYKPEPIFHGDKKDPRKYGVELEVDKGNYCNDTAEQIQDDNSEIYCKHDGSLNDGFEIVSHPCTLDYHLNSLDWEGIMNTCLENSFQSHSAETCGLHVHISRKAFGNNSTEQDLNIAKLIYLFEKFWNQIKTFSRRTEYQINKWAKNYGLSTISEAELKTKNNNGRYFAVNLENDHTIEIRIFRGTLKYNTFAATLQFCNLLMDAITAGTIQDIQSLIWQDIIQGAKEYPELTEYFIQRNLID